MSDTISHSLDLVIPVFNEAENIEAVLREIEAKLRMPHLINVVFDSEQDNTLPVLRRWQESHNNVILHRNRYGKGVLNAIRTGLESASGEVVLVVMADLSDDLDDVAQMFLMAQQGYDIVCGSRYMQGGKQIGGPLLKSYLSRLAGISLHYLTGLPTRDATNSFKMYRRKILETFPIESQGGFELGFELLVKAWASGFRIIEIPTVWRDRQHGRSRFKLWRWMPAYLRWYWFAFRHRLYSRC